nr:zinc-ribbon domain-containing protein [Acidobacteriota bacterium]
MYCPRCGQQQASEEMRFCSRCGFPLGGVRELLANDGAVSTSEDEEQGQVVSPRRRGISQGVMMMLLGTVIVPVLAILSKYINGLDIKPLVALSAVLFFVGGFVRILYAILFEKGLSGKKILTPASDT